ncbi:CBN-FBXC-29 protein [Caenorhabditis brenneri]|uniref:CBN-FBXC-29 protein n=1 Tax=Caenorhabditis brenneri TaxID=135651 RepID=G0MDH9_CAEBE|nr:CBN-FBXC-29 protein [Caenorhabditis brenneri]
MSDKPFAYDSLKILLQYLDPNLRIQLSTRSPSLRATEKLVPLRIDNLSFNNRKTNINNTTYCIGLLRKFPPGEEILEMEDESPDGAENDYDQFGFIDHHPETRITRGDVDLRYWFGDLSELEESKIEAMQELLEQDLEGYERSLRHLSITKKRKREADRQQEIADVKGKISRTRKELKRFYCKRDGIPLDYTRLIQFSIFPHRKEILTYNRTLPEAMRYLHSLLFEGRSCPVEVNTLEISGPNQILRFPENFKLNVKKIKTEMIPFGSFDHIISSYASTYIVIKYNMFTREENYDQAAIRNSKSLLIDGLPNFSEFFYTLQSKCVIIPTSTNGHDHSGLVKYWLEHGKPVGSVYTFGIDKEETAKEHLGKIKANNEELVTSDQEGSLTFLMPAPNSQLRVYYENYCPIRNIFQEFAVFDWVLVLKVESV